MILTSMTPTKKTTMKMYIESLSDLFIFSHKKEEFMPESSKNVIREVSKSEESSKNEKSSRNKNKRSTQKGKENVPSQKSIDSENQGKFENKKDHFIYLKK